MKQLLYFAYFILLLASCTKEVNIDIPQYKPDLVVDGSIEAGGYPIVLLSTSLDIYQESYGGAWVNSFITDANVQVACEGDTHQLNYDLLNNFPVWTQKKFAEMLRADWPEITTIPLMVYSCTSFVAQPNKVYELLIDYKGKRYSAKTFLPLPTPLQSVSFVPTTENPLYGELKAILSDPPVQTDYYKLETRRIDIFQGSVIDEIFKRARRSYFRDRYYNGGTVDFMISNNLKNKDSLNHDPLFRDYFKNGDSVVIKLSKIDKNVFMFFRKKNEQLQNLGNPYSSPMNIPTNIDGGALGIWAGCTPWLDTIVCQ
ncbi:MAG: hypothetical protein RL264_3052 [Bacteroidota bacterium]